MGDSGSLTIGLVMSILALKMVDLDPPSLISPLSEICKPLLAIAILIYPLTDTLRIFIYRALKGTSPFAADRNHIHHRLQDAGFNHRQVSALLYSMNLGIVLTVIFTYRLEPTVAFFILLIAIIVLIQIPFLIGKKIQNKS